MNLLQENNFDTSVVHQGAALQVIDFFSDGGKKTIELQAHSSLIYLVVAGDADIELKFVTTGPHCSCKIFGLFTSDAQHHVKGKLTVSLDHSQTSADVELISFLYDGAKAAIDGSLDIAPKLVDVHGRLLEHNIVLGTNVSITTLPKLSVSSANVHASHGANIDMLDEQKLFYMKSRGLTQEQSQALLVNGYIDHVISHFSEISASEKEKLYKKLYT